MNPALVQVCRVDTVVPLHRGAVAGGTVFSALGDIDARVFPRSAIKVLQALPLHQPADRNLIDSLADVTLKNWRGVDVARLHAAAALRELHNGPRRQ
jgi:hypothetical protein